MKQSKINTQKYDPLIKTLGKFRMEYQPLIAIFAGVGGGIHTRRMEKLEKIYIPPLNFKSNEKNSPNNP
jgi:hypothetical protein